MHTPKVVEVTRHATADPFTAHLKKEYDIYNIDVLFRFLIIALRPQTPKRIRSD
jgi:hypothetical protein